MYMKEIPKSVPVRVDFAGGWLDVPKFSLQDAFIINCTIVPEMSLDKCPYEKGGGIGGSAAYALLCGKEPIEAELNMGVGWQDPAIIMERGLCVWRSGVKPILEAKFNPDWLYNRMGLYWTGKRHSTVDLLNLKRDYQLINWAGLRAYEACFKKQLATMCLAVNESYFQQVKDEGMEELPNFGESAKKYCGSGHGGYALYMFRDEYKRVEFLKRENTMDIQPVL